MDRRLDACRAAADREILPPVLGERVPSLVIEAALDVDRDGWETGTYFEYFCLFARIN